MKSFAIVGLLILIALALSSCNVLIEQALSRLSPTETPAPTVPPPPSPQPLPQITRVIPPTVAQPTAASSGNPLDALTKSFRGWGSVKSFRARVTTTGGTGAALEMNIDVITPDRFHATSKQFEMILIGANIYLKIGNQWQKVALAQAIDLTFADPKKLEKELGISTEVKLIGPELLDGTPTLVYQYTSTSSSAAGEKYTAKVWVGVADNFPRKVEATAAKGAKTTIIYYDFNANITITPPIP